MRHKSYVRINPYSFALRKNCKEPIYYTNYARAPTPHAAREDKFQHMIYLTTLCKSCCHLATLAVNSDISVTSFLSVTDVVI